MLEEGPCSLTLVVHQCLTTPFVHSICVVVYISRYVGKATYLIIYVCRLLNFINIITYIFTTTIHIETVVYGLNLISGTLWTMST